MSTKEKVVVFTGSGVSVESGIATYRSDTGLWHNHSILEVCHTEGWSKNPKKVLEFWNERRKEVQHAKPNAAHLAIAKLEEKYDVTVVTQNVDPLHSDAGSSNVLHLHGEITKVRSDNIGACYLYDIGYQDVVIGDKCQGGYQLRPHICFFNEDPFCLQEALGAIESADKILVVGTSLEVQPAASLVYRARNAKERIVIDPGSPKIPVQYNHHKGLASELVPALVDSWLS